MTLFVDKSEIEVTQKGVGYLREGLLFLLYGYYRGIWRPEWSIVLTIFSLGTRVLLAYTLSPYYGEKAIWGAIVIGWILADIVGIIAIRKVRIKKDKL